MWSLKNMSNSKRHFFLVGREYLVGRRDSDILIQDDMSISRKHATIKVNHSERNLSNADKPSQLVIKDVSKLGTQLPTRRISNGDEEVLREGDIISFGTSCNNKFEVVCEPFIVTSSCFPAMSKKSFKKVLFKLGGSLLNEWTSKCVCVVMVNLSLTVKVACALLSQKHVVTPEFFEDILKHAELSDLDFKEITNRLDTSHYLPVMSESQLNPSSVSFAPLPQRSSIFQDKTFIFLLSEQYTRLKPVVELASGGSTFLDITKCDFRIDQRVKEVLSGGCVMLPESNDNSMQHQDKIQLIINCLSKSNRRFIPESEIGFAILYCSTQQYCNPLKKAPYVSNTTQVSVSEQHSINKEATSLSQSSAQSRSVFAASELQGTKPSGKQQENKKTKAKQGVTFIEETPIQYELTDVNETDLIEKSRKEDAEKGRDTEGDSSVNLFPVDSELEERNEVKPKVNSDLHHRGTLDGVSLEAGKSSLKREYASDEEDSKPPTKVSKTHRADGGLHARSSQHLPNDSKGLSFNSTKTSPNHTTLPPSTNQSSQPLVSQEGHCFNTKVMSRQHLDTSVVPLTSVQSKCALVTADLLVRGMKPALVDWNGLTVPNFKSFVKSKGTEAPFMICANDLYVQPPRDLKSLKIDCIS